MAHIVRIDGTKSKGWQVRGPGKRGYTSKMFSDGKYGGREKALELAKGYKKELDKLEPPARRPEVPPYRDKPLATNVSGIVGVYRSHSYHKTGLKQEYWAAFCSIGPDGGRYTKRFYINDERDEEEAFRLAVEFRQMWEEAVDQGEAAIQRFFAEYESGWL